MEQERPPTEEGSPRREESAPATGEVRIAAVEAAVAAGLSAPPPLPEGPSEATEAYELPAWTDPPTGQVPRVLLEDPSAEASGQEGVRGPTWRQESSDWDDTEDLSFFSEEADEVADTSIAGRVDPEEAPFSFSFAELDPSAAPPEEEGDLEAAWAPLLAQGEAPEHLAASRRVRRRHSARRSRSEGPADRRDGKAAVLTGLSLAALVVICLLLGPLATLLLAAVAFTITAGEAYGALQGAGYRPSTLVGLLFTPALVVAAYLHQGAGVVVIGAGAFVAVAAFQLLRRSEEPLVSMSVTLFVLGWVGGLGAFAGLLLAPADFSHHDGIDLVLAALLLSVAHDIGSYLVGSRLGRHHLAAVVSPGKTLEGLAGGTLLTLVLAALGVSHLRPLHLLTAVVLGLLVSVLGPLGDLTESLIKRDLELKDMGSLLPGHGGLFDRIDALLFVLPATYCLARLVHLS